MRNQRPFTKQRIFDKAPGESVNPLKRVKSVIEKAYRAHLGNGWKYAKLNLTSAGLENSIAVSVTEFNEITSNRVGFYFTDDKGNTIISETKNVEKFLDGLQTSKSFKLYITSTDTINTRVGKKTLDKINLICNFTKTTETNYKVTSFWNVKDSPAKFGVAEVGKFVKEVFIPQHESQLDAQDTKLITDAMRFWHTL